MSTAKKSDNGYAYTLVYRTPDGEVRTSFVTQQGFAVHRAHVIERYGEKAIVEQSGPNLKENKKHLLTEAS